MNRRAKAPPSTALRFFRGLLLLGALGALLVFVSLISALPGFGYRSPRRSNQDFRSAQGRTSHAPQTEDAAEIAIPLQGEEELQTVTLFFPRKDRPYQLFPVSSHVPRGGSMRETLRATIQALKFPVSSGLLPAVDSEVKVLAHFFQGETLILSLSPEFQRPLIRGLTGSYATLQALTHTLSTLPQVGQVRLLINNSEALNFRESHDLSLPVPPSPEAVDSSPLPVWATPISSPEAL